MFLCTEVESLRITLIMVEGVCNDAGIFTMYGGTITSRIPLIMVEEYIIITWQVFYSTEVLSLLIMLEVVEEYTLA